MTPKPGSVLVEVWSDVVCPWCYIGKRNLECALDQFEGDVEVRWRSFELDPNAPAVRSRPYAERLARKYGVDVEGAKSMVDRMVGTGERAGITFRFDLARTGNTFDAHRVLHLAADRGIQGTMKERLLAAALSEGEPLGDAAALTRVATEAGLDHGEVLTMLASDAYGDAVRADERAAFELDVTGVPFFLVDGQLAIPGAQAPDLLLRVMHRASADSTS